MHKTLHFIRSNTITFLIKMFLTIFIFQIILYFCGNNNFNRWENRLFDCLQHFNWNLLQADSYTKITGLARFPTHLNTISSCSRQPLLPFSFERIYSPLTGIIEPHNGCSGTLVFFTRAKGSISLLCRNFSKVRRTCAGP